MNFVESGDIVTKYHGRILKEHLVTYDERTNNRIFGKRNHSISAHKSIELTEPIAVIQCTFS